MQAIESDRSRLRRERNDALQVCQELQHRVQEATDRIAIGKNQLQQSVTEHREFGLKNQKLQAQVRTLREDLESCKKANVKAETLLEDELKKSEVRLAEADADFKKLKARCSALRDRLDIMIREQKALARDSKQHWNQSVEKCKGMKLEIKGELQTAIDNVGGAVESIKRSTAVVEQASDVLMNQNILSLEDQVRQAEEQVRKANEENRGLREELEYQRRSNKSIESYKNDIIAAIGTLQDQFESNYSSQDNDSVRSRLDSMLSLLESSKGESQSTKNVVEGLEGRLKDSLSLFANEVHQSADSHKTLMQEISRIEQTLCCEMKTLRETHSTREAEMRRELASLAEEKAKSTASLEVERLKLQHIEETNEKRAAQIAALQDMVEVTKTQLLSATQRAENDSSLLRQEVAAKQQQLEALQEDSTRTKEKNQQEVTRLTAKIQDLKKSAMVNQQREVSDMDIKKLQESESRALQELHGARSEIVRLKQESKAETEELQKQLKISEQRHANLAHKMKAKGILSSPPGSIEAGEPNATQLEKNLQQLAGTEKYLEKLATKATDVKEMEAMIRTLVEIQGVLRSTLELSIRETLQMESGATSDQQPSGTGRSSSVPASSYTATQVTNPVGKQIILRTPSQDGEEPGVAALAPGQERMLRRIRRPEKSILRQTTGPTAPGQPVADSAAPPQQPLESFAALPRGGRSYSRPVEGKPVQSAQVSHPAGRNNEAVQSIKTTLVGGQLNSSESDSLTSLAAWKLGAQGPAAVPTNKRAASNNDHDAADKGRQSSQARQEAAISENAGGNADRPRKRMRTYTGRTRSQDMVEMPPSNQQAQMA
ncbi:hypothetical protein F5X68DRAFT_251377 [Plectosphaerella plurivora]|uniref:Uncharacterized protein n=1 Tax=Plectosphaerella plurivora TaxID=936078 RepID=A0A9P8V1F4_9PEZI|nr:hypothetical protein F5X68DRAFT_251377 [Plectosphaerella plurivora]